MALKLAKAGLEVAAVEHGPWRDTGSDYNIGIAPDELRYAICQNIFLRLAQDTRTARNIRGEVALPTTCRATASAARACTGAATLALHAHRLQPAQPPHRAMAGASCPGTALSRTGR